jgi:hypothetical protein
VDGVVHLTVRAYDPNGAWMNEWANGYYQPNTHALNTTYLYPPTVGIGNGYGEAQLYMFSNAVPAAVDLELGVMEDHAIARAESLPNTAPNYPQTTYLQGQAGTLHLFHQRVNIPNVDTTAYQ